MSDSQAFLLIVIAIYVSECLGWRSKHTVIFHTVWGHKWHATVPGRWFGNQNGGAYLRWVLPPLGTSYLCSVWPLSISPRGCYSYVSYAMGLHVRLEQPEEYVGFGGGVPIVQVADRDVLIDGRKLMRASSVQLAHWLARCIKRISRSSVDQRPEVIDHSIQETLNVQQLDQRITEHQATSSLVRLSCNLLFLYIFFCVPITALTWGLAATWIPLLSGLLMGLGTTLFTFARAHRSLFEDAKTERRKQILLMLLNPLSAIRAHDVLSKDVLVPYHPLAVGYVLMDSDGYQQFTRRFLLDLHFPLRPESPNMVDVALEVEQWFHHRYRDQIDQFLTALGHDVGQLLAPDIPDGAHVRSYCPRCQCQFTLSVGTCEACGGIGLLSFSRN